MTEYEGIVRLGVFAGVLLLMMLLEAVLPRRQRRHDRLLRWPANFAVVLMNTVLVRLFFPAAAVGFAVLMSERGVGLLNQLEVAKPVAILLSMVALDLSIYLQHVLFHRIPALWRIHRMHHTDLDIDVTTGNRFHPLEILLSMLIKCIVIGILGAPAVAVLLFEIFINAGAMFNHANLRLPGTIDRALRLVIVTPDMHRIHHSVRPAETDSNFGFNLSWWDRLFGTYIEQPADGHEAMVIGIQELQTIDELRISRMLALPFVKAPANTRGNRG